LVESCHLLEWRLSLNTPIRQRTSCTPRQKKQLSLTSISGQASERRGASSGQPEYVEKDDNWSDQQGQVGRPFRLRVAVCHPRKGRTSVGLEYRARSLAPERKQATCYQTEVTEVKRYTAIRLPKTTPAHRTDAAHSAYGAMPWLQG
jgi:hypothetical protein